MSKFEGKKNSILNLKNELINDLFENIGKSKIYLTISNSQFTQLYIYYKENILIKKPIQLVLNSCQNINNSLIQKCKLFNNYDIRSINIKINDTLYPNYITELTTFLISKQLSYINIDLSHTHLNQNDYESLATILELLCNSLESLKLNLSNKDIDNIKISTLVKPFRKLKLKSLSLNLHNNQLSDKGIIIFSLFLRNLKELKFLNIDFESNNISCLGVPAFSTSLTRIKNLQHISLNFNSNFITEKGLLSILESLNKLPLLTILELYMYEIKLQFLDKFCLYFSKMKDRLQSFTLNLSNNILGNEMEILSLLRDSQLNYNSNVIGSNGFTYLASTIKELKYLKCLKLYLHNTNINQEGIIAASNSLKNIKNLEKLSLRLDMNSIDNHGLNSLAKCLIEMKLLTNLQLELSHNRISNIELFSKAILELKHLKFLVLILDNNEIEDNINMRFMSEGLRILVNLNSLFLSLSFNMISDFSHISQSFKNMRHLRELSLSFSHNKINKASYKTLKNSLILMENLFILTLNFSKTNLEDDEFIELIKSINKLLKLKELSIDINKNSITDTGAKYLLKSFSYLKLNILFLNLRNNKISQEMKEILTLKYEEKIDL